ncbi:FecR protein [Arachidicoccus rhizosphaerae]|uniref:FecR protein n=1 Tax=Arachidicoccus rhizosphaerae TaxID=551991 RepID=A0A1H4ALI0_9BACT|nr:FecR family protein [Arachidicoccus rhizosphaerae]SEA36638.1 FecR protein [Arachidicoccus rhizosphaerae]
MNSVFTTEEIKRFLNNELDELLKDNKAEKIAEYLKSLSDEELNQILPDQEFEQIQPAIIPKVIRVKMHKNIKRQINGQGNWYKILLIAACLIGLVFAGYYLLNITINPTSNLPLTQDLARTIITNKTKSDSYIHLPDGSGVLLKPEAQISYLSNFTQNRFVYMQGNARFDVLHNPNKPFSVIANGIGTLDIGTSFWVNNNKSKGEVTVTLLEGSIAVKSIQNNIPEKNIYLKPGQKIKISKIKGNYIVSNTQQRKESKILSDYGAITSNKQVQTNWTNEAFSFSKSPLQNVFEQLSARYHVEITVNPAILKDREFTGKIMYGDSLNILLDAICNLNQLKYNRKGNKIQITNK